MAIADHFLDLIEEPARALSPNQFLFAAFLLWNRERDMCFASILNHQFLYSISSMMVSLLLLSRQRNKGIAHFNWFSVGYLVPQMDLKLYMAHSEHFAHFSFGILQGYILLQYS